MYDGYEKPKRQEAPLETEESIKRDIRNFYWRLLLILMIPACILGGQWDRGLGAVRLLRDLLWVRHLSHRVGLFTRSIGNHSEFLLQVLLH